MIDKPSAAGKFTVAKPALLYPSLFSEFIFLYGSHDPPRRADNRCGAAGGIMQSFPALVNRMSLGVVSPGLRPAISAMLACAALMVSTRAISAEEPVVSKEPATCGEGEAAAFPVRRLEVSSPAIQERLKDYRGLFRIRTRDEAENHLPEVLDRIDKEVDFEKSHLVLIVYAANSPSHAPLECAVSEGYALFVPPNLPPREGADHRKATDAAIIKTVEYFIVDHAIKADYSPEARGGNFGFRCIEVRSDRLERKLQGLNGLLRLHTREEAKARLGDGFEAIEEEVNFDFFDLVAIGYAASARTRREFTLPFPLLTDDGGILFLDDNELGLARQGENIAHYVEFHVLRKSVPASYERS